MAARIQGKEYPIKDILCEKFEFSIPMYQRPYAWKIEQAETLLDDLITALGDLDDPSDDVESYFMGSLVVVKEEDKPKAEVVDGQQRLTTITILLSTIRALLDNPDERSTITSFIYQKGAPMLKTADHFHLSLREKDREFFQEFIQKDVALTKIKSLNISDLSDSQKNISENAKKYLEKLSVYSQPQLNAIATYILNQCFLIIVSTPNIESAYKIFSILNDRGLDLSYTDICKAEVIGKIDIANQDTYTRKWEDAEDMVGRDNFKEVFAHLRTIHRKVKPKEALLKEIRNYVISKYSSKTFIDTVLVPYTTAFDVLHTSSYQNIVLAEDINRVLKWLNLIDNFDWLPPAMAFYTKHKHDPNLLLRFLIDLERVAACSMIRRENINLRLVRYGEILKKIENDEDLFEPTSQLQLSKEEIKQTIERLNGEVYNSGARIYILRRLDAELSETKTTPELPIFTVEHVLPQNPDINSIWMKWYPDENARKVWTHRLGNLALLSRRKNSQAQNFEFEKKKDQYFNSPVTPFALTTQIIKQNSWTFDVLQNRHNESLAILKKLWRLTE